MFYKKPVFDKDMAILYAHTNNKEYAKEFKNIRDMNQFVLKEDKMTESEYDLFSIKHSKYRLIEGGFYTLDTKDYGRRETVNLVCTVLEEEKTCLTTIEKIFKENFVRFVDYSWLNDNYIYLLDDILYTKFYHFYKNDKIELMLSPHIGIICDELKVFLNYYGHTFKVDK